MADFSKLTLPDLIKDNLDILFVGINPGIRSAKRGHYYAGPTNHFWKCLFLSGLVSQPYDCEDDSQLLSHGIGFVNVVQRTTRSSSDLRTDELKDGSVRLRRLIAEYKPHICAFNGKGIFKVFSQQTSVDYGLQPLTADGDEQPLFYVLPSSSARCSQFPTFFDKVPFFVELKRTRDQFCCPGADPSVEAITPPTEVPEGESSYSCASDSQQSFVLEDFSLMDSDQSLNLAIPPDDAAGYRRSSVISMTGQGGQDMATMWDNCGSFLKYSSCTSAPVCEDPANFLFGAIPETASDLKAPENGGGSSSVSKESKVEQENVLRFVETSSRNSPLVLPFDLPRDFSEITDTLPIVSDPLPPNIRRRRSGKDEQVKRCLLSHDVAAHVQEAIDAVVDRARNGLLEIQSFMTVATGDSLASVSSLEQLQNANAANYDIFHNFGSVPQTQAARQQEELIRAGYGSHVYALNNYVNQQMPGASYIHPYSTVYRGENAATFSPQTFGSMLSHWGSSVGHQVPFTSSHSEFSPASILPFGMVPHHISYGMQNVDVEGDRRAAANRCFDASSLNSFNDMSSTNGERSPALAHRQQQQFNGSFSILPSPNSYTSQGSNSDFG